MLTYDFFLSWLMVMFPLVYSPGPANTLFAANGAQFGFKKSIPFMAGIDVVFVVQSLIVGFGLSTLLIQFPAIFNAIRYIGIAYILYLAGMFLRAATKENKETPDCLNFVDGMLLTMVNPKAWVMQIMMFSQFMHTAETWITSIIKLTCLLSVLNISGHVVWIWLGSTLLSTSSTHISPRVQNTIFAIMLFGSVWFLL